MTVCAERFRILAGIVIRYTMDIFKEGGGRCGR